MGAMQRAVDQLIAQGALKPGTSLKDYTPAETKKLQDNMPMAFVRGLNTLDPDLKVTGTVGGPSPAQQIQSKSKTKSKTSRRSTMLTGPQGLRDTDLKVKRKRLLGTES